MRVLIFGATGMIGQGVLIECLEDPEITSVLSLSRRPTGKTDPKLREIQHHDFYDYSAMEGELATCDVCFFCLGVSAAGMSEERYSRLTYDLTLAAAETLCRANPGMTFFYVSGSGTDSSEKGRIMWARVKGRTENALLRLPFAAAYMFRPAFIQPLKGIESSTRIYRILYRVMRPFSPLVRLLAPGYYTTTEELGRAMIAVAKRGFERPIVEGRDLRGLT